MNPGPRVPGERQPQAVGAEGGGRGPGSGPAPGAAGETEGHAPQGAAGGRCGGDTRDALTGCRRGARVSRPQGRQTRARRHSPSVASPPGHHVICGRSPATHPLQVSVLPGTRSRRKAGGPRARLTRQRAGGGRLSGPRAQEERLRCPGRPLGSATRLHAAPGPGGEGREAPASVPAEAATGVDTGRGCRGRGGTTRERQSQRDDPGSAPR